MAGHARVRRGDLMARFRFGCLLIALAVSACRTPERPPSPATQLSAPDLLAMPAPANTRYYVVLFGSQSSPKRPRYSHTWATAVKVTQAPGAQPVIESHTISWLPTSMKIRAWQIWVKPGSNVELHTTIDEMLRTRQQIAMWGP